MSSSPTGPSSTTASSTSSGSTTVVEEGPSRLAPLAPRCEPLRPSRSQFAVVACGAIAQPVADVVARRGWAVDVHPLPPLLHNQPQLIAGEVRTLATSLAASYDRVAVAYADCGTY